jgi:type I restriction enzyme S subunit
MSQGAVRVRLADLAAVQHGFAFDGEFFTDDPTPHILVTPGNFARGGGFKEEKLRYYAGPVPSEFVLCEGDLVVTMTDLSKDGDTLGYPAIVPHRTGTQFLHNQRIGKVCITRPDLLNRDYLYYLLRSDEYRHEVLASATGSTVRHTSPTRIGAFSFVLPALGEQQAVAAVLRHHDRKIDLNTRTNQTLGALARALFKSWFVDFDPVRAKTEGREPAGMDATTAAKFPESFVGRLPLGWRESSIYELAQVAYGAPFASKCFNDAGQGRPLIRIRDLATHSPEVFTTESLDKQTLVHAGDIVVGMDGEFRAHHWRGPVSLLNQRVCKFTPLADVPPMFVSLAIVEPLRFFENAKTGTTVIHLGKADIDTFRIVNPGNEVLRAFGQFTTPLLHRVLSNQAESRTLAALRDLLAPKLLSGELRVNNAEKVVSAAV